ncbi:hypothetical protein [Ornithinimicrobium murale]|uniref:hypothetical protein n=1 Tax=Ornithinimicrobium murale TaxID=1050153 RepID=UPI000E0D7786|nr:hypothetical protein [Ornithinimicrobium murale]
MPSTSPLPAAPGPDDFRALARSSPWRFGTLHLTHRPSGGTAGEEEPVEAWLRRPGHLEVLAGGERHVETGVPYTRSALYLEEPRAGLRRRLSERLRGRSARLRGRSARLRGRSARLRGWSAVPGLAPREVSVDPAVVPPQSVEPVRRSDGLVLERPSGVDYDDPMWQNYRWVAMLDPVELSHGVDLGEVHARERLGRPTWTATCRPLPASSEDFGDGYDPRCSCCALLFGAVSQALEFPAGDPLAPVPEEVAGYPSAYWVSLDVETGIVVDVEPQDGERTRTSFSNVIHEVGPLPAATDR